MIPAAHLPQAALWTIKPQAKLRMAGRGWRSATPPRKAVGTAFALCRETQGATALLTICSWRKPVPMCKKAARPLPIWCSLALLSSRRVATEPGGISAAAFMKRKTPCPATVCALQARPRSSAGLLRPFPFKRNRIILTSFPAGQGLTLCPTAPRL